MNHHVAFPLAISASFMNFYPIESSLNEILVNVSSGLVAFSPQTSIFFIEMFLAVFKTRFSVIFFKNLPQKAMHLFGILT